MVLQHPQLSHPQTNKPHRLLWSEIGKQKGEKLSGCCRIERCTTVTCTLVLNNIILSRWLTRAKNQERTAWETLSMSARHFTFLRCMVLLQSEFSVSLAILASSSNDEFRLPHHRASVTEHVNNRLLMTTLCSRYNFKRIVTGSPFSPSMLPPIKCWGMIRWWFTFVKVLMLSKQCLLLNSTLFNIKGMTAKHN